ncbi:MAG: hypothetical protein C5B57_02330 [Blastocatellia bacterium]|nr:MAG: hypothetical protein C5B57_02330 [Blastocatellia bacterium]
MHSFAEWLSATEMSALVNEYSWIWPACETLHFVGLALLIGNIGLVDLRLLGVEKRLALAPLSRFIRFAVLGFSINLLTGIVFFVGNPLQYINNIAFGFKIAFIALACVNVAIFYVTGVNRKVALMGPGDDAPPLAKFIAAMSLFLWIAVMYMGRMLPYIGNSF